MTTVVTTRQARTSKCCPSAALLWVCYAPRIQTRNSTTCSTTSSIRCVKNKNWERHTPKQRSRNRKTLMRPPSKLLVKVEPLSMDKLIKELLTKKLSKWNSCRKDVKKRRKKSKSRTEVWAPIWLSSISRWIKSMDKIRICLTPVWPRLHKSAFRKCTQMVWLASLIQRPKR